MIRPNRYPWVEIVDPKPEPTFTLDQIIEKMVEMFGDNIVDPDHHPLITKYRFNLAKFELARRPVAVDPQV